ncbi:MAG: hypothetical protein M1133_07555 [Armatimonadetes bacterium]|nr:hypothetical protein [Armatimonadota bacterium]
MKLAIYCLVLVVIAVAGIGAAFLSISPGDGRRETPPPRTVFVDVGRLVNMHPDWGALATMRSTVTGIRQVSRAGYSVVRKPASLVVRQRSDAADRALRSSLEEATVRRADEALRQLEMEQRRSLQARLDASRASIGANAESDLRVRERQIEDEAASEASSVTQKHRRNLLEAQIRADALHVAAGGSPGLDTVAIKLKEQQAQSELNTLRAVYDAETDRVNADAKAKIEMLRQGMNEKIDSTLNEYGSVEAKDIETRAASARSQILNDMNAFGAFPSMLGAGARKDGRHPKGVPDIAVSKRVCVGDMCYWQADSEALEARIRSDVRRAVLKMAEETGVKVVFVPSGTALPDATREFVDLMRTRGWRACEPVLYRAKGS